MSSFRGNTAQIPPIGPQGQNSPAIYNAIAGHHNQHAQHSPIVQNDTLVGNALKTVSTNMKCIESLPPLQLIPSVPVRPVSLDVPH